MAANDTFVQIEVVLEDGTVTKAFRRIQKDGENAADGIQSRFTKAFSGLTGTLGGLGAAFAATFAVGRVIDAASKQENAITSLNQALVSAGRFSKAASLDFQDFASRLQQTTTVGDETTLELLSLASTFARTNEEAKALTQAAIELGAATGRDARASLIQLGKTLGGVGGELNEVVPAVRELTAEQLKAGAAIDLVAQRFAGSAAAATTTYQGRTIQLSNAIGDLAEEIGFFITKSDTATESAGFLTRAFSAITDVLRQSRFESSSDEVERLTARISNTERALESATKKYADLVRQQAGFDDSIVGRIRKIGLTEEQFQKAIDQSRKDIEALTRSLNDATQERDRLLSERGDGDIAAPAFDEKAFQANQNLFLQKYQEGLLAQLQADLQFQTQQQNLTEQARIQQEIATVQFNQRIAQINSEFYDGETLKVGVNQEEINSLYAQAANQRDAIIQASQEKLRRAQEESELSFARIGRAAQQGLGVATGQAFTAFGNALAKGANATEAFKDAFLQAIGGQLSQLGQGYILQGIAASLNPLTPGAGAGLIGAGIALTTFGGFLSGSGGGGAPSAGAPGGVPLSTQPAPEVGPVTDVSAINDAAENAQPSTEVSVVIQGDVLDSDDTGLRIVDIINNAFDKQGVVIKRGALA